MRTVTTGLTIQRRQTWKRSGVDTTSRASGNHSTRGSERNSTGGSKNHNFGFTMKKLNSFFIPHLRCLHHGLSRCFSESLTPGNPRFFHIQNRRFKSAFSSPFQVTNEINHIFKGKVKNEGGTMGGRDFSRNHQLKLLGGGWACFGNDN